MSYYSECKEVSDEFFEKYSDSHEVLTNRNQSKVQNSEAVIVGGLVFDGYPTKEFIKENRKMFNMAAVENRWRKTDAISVRVWNKGKTAYVTYCNDGKSKANGSGSYMKLVYGENKTGKPDDFCKKGERTDRKEIFQFLAEN